MLSWSTRKADDHSMDADAPRCPTCGSPVQPDWDWCQLCGYDPDGLKPAGWMPAGLAPEPAAVEEGRRHRRRASKRSERAEARAKEPVAAGGASIAALVDPLVAPLTPEARATPTTASAPQPEPKPVSSIVPPLVIAEAPARPKAAPAEQVFHVSPARLESGAALVMVVVAVGVGYLAVKGILSVADGASTSMLDNVSTVVFILVCAVLAAALLAQARALMRQRVILSQGELEVHNRFGRVRHLSRDEIHILRMGERRFQTPRGLSNPLDVPYVQLTDGSVVWLDALGACTPMSAPSDAQQQMFETLGDALESSGTRR
jgi:hypothetical protein